MYIGCLARVCHFSQRIFLPVITVLVQLFVLLRLRRHPAPPLSNFDPLVKAARQQGYTVEVETGKLLADSLNRAVDPAKPYMNTMLRMIATRCMMQAVYFASGSIEEPLFRFCLFIKILRLTLFCYF